MDVNREKYYFPVGKVNMITLYPLDFEEFLWANGKEEIADKCNKVNEGKLPLSAYADNSTFKVYLTDTGLLCSKFGIPPNAVLVDITALEGFKGFLAENYVSASLMMNGYFAFNKINMRIKQFYIIID